jgi:hypothetical protein
MKNKFMLWIITLFIISCSPYTIPFKIKQEPLKQDLIKINGFYHSETSGLTFILYKNGVLLRVYLVDKLYHTESASKVQSFWTKDIYLSDIYNKPYYWGVFTITNNKINIEYWLNADGCICPNAHNGLVINDSTLILDTNTFNFYSLSIKPDSTNRFIK